MTEPEDKVAAAKQLFAKMQKPKRLSKNTHRIIHEFGADIQAAHARGVPWKQLAEGLETVGIEVSAEYLRAVMDKHAASIKLAKKGEAPPVVTFTRKKPTKKKTAEGTSTPPSLDEDEEPDTVEHSDTDASQVTDSTTVAPSSKDWGERKY